MKRAKTLLLGHTSFTGKALAAELERRGRAWEGLSSRELDLTGERAHKRLSARYGPKDAVVLLSRVSRSLPPWDQFAGDMAIAVNCAKAVSERKAGLFVFASTTSVYGDAVTDLRVTEATPPAPGTPYAVAKFAAERLLTRAAALSGTPLLILRPSMLYGPGDESTAYGPARFIRSALSEGKVRVFGDGLERRDYLFVDDLAQAAVDLMRARKTGVFNVGTGKPRSFMDIASMLERLVGGRVRVEREPRRTPKADQRLVVAKLRAVLPGFAPRDLASGLSETLRRLTQNAP